MKRGVGKKKKNFKTINNVLLVVLVVEMIFLLGIIVIPNAFLAITGNPVKTTDSGSSSLPAFIILILLVVGIIVVFVLRALKANS